MVSKKIKYARAHLSRQKHIAILATPLWRRMQSMDFNCLPRPFSVPHTALKAQASKRIKLMARPKNFKKFERRSTQSQGSLQYPRLNRESTGFDVVNKRILDLSLPKKRALIHARMYSISLSNRHQMETINNLLLGLTKSRYQKYRIICSTLHQRQVARERKIRKKLHKALASPGDWERHNSALKKLAAPKRVHEPPQPPKPTKKKKYSLERLNALAQPINLHPIMMSDPFSVKKSALTYRITKHMKHLAKIKNIPEPIFNVPGQVNPMALLIEASTRIINLAKSVVRPLGLETDLKKNAFSVSPSALKAICSPRLKVLAKPKKRPPHKR